MQTTINVIPTLMRRYDDVQAHAVRNGYLGQWLTVPAHELATMPEYGALGPADRVLFWRVSIACLREMMS